MSIRAQANVGTYFLPLPHKVAINSYLIPALPPSRMTVGGTDSGIRIAKLKSFCKAGAVSTSCLYTHAEMPIMGIICNCRPALHHASHSHMAGPRWQRGRNAEARYIQNSVCHIQHSKVPRAPSACYLSYLQRAAILGRARSSGALRAAILPLLGPVSVALVSVV